jgi:hypothetical protein
MQPTAVSAPGNATASSAPQLTPPEEQGANSLAVAGFTLSLLGLICACGLISPLGLLVSLLGLRNPGRPLAVSGVLIGGFGTLIALVEVAVGGWVVYQYSVQRPFDVTGNVLWDARRDVADEIKRRGRMLTPEEGNELLLYDKDGWGTPLRYEPLPGAERRLRMSGSVFDIRNYFMLQSAGPDRVFDTPDDPIYNDGLQNLPERVLPELPWDR